MKKPISFGCAGLALALGLAGGSAVGKTPDVQPPRSQSTQAETSIIKYEPPDRGKTGGRIGASTRGMAHRDLNLEVLAPDHIGFTATNQPVLYWFLSQP